MYSSFSASSFLFQSTYLYKVRQISNFVLRLIEGFNPRTYIRYDKASSETSLRTQSFNPRTYIRYDLLGAGTGGASLLFQSTYLYKVRLSSKFDLVRQKEFQSTYLYKVRHLLSVHLLKNASFNPRTYIRYDPHQRVLIPVIPVSIHVPI